MLSWVNRFNIFCLLDNQNYSSEDNNFELLLAAGVQQHFNSLAELDEAVSQGNWIFGHLSYEVNHHQHQLSPKPDRIGFPLMYFFVPQVVIAVTGTHLSVFAEEPHDVLQSLQQQQEDAHDIVQNVFMQQSLTRDEYLSKIAALQEHISRGDCYEINFCIDFFAENAVADPVFLFQSLMKVSPNPFSVFYRKDDSYLICASPERFLLKKGSHIFSQPIKGTIKRDLQNEAEDERLKKQLFESTKDRSENVMVVDLVRNDLSRICKEGTVRVNELFEIKSYPQVHQMISTVSGELEDDIRFSKIIEATFPMGSMTGAPKHRVMQLIEEYETSARGIFSGSVGYFAPDGSFDFNVVIRSIMYNAATKYLSYKVGSGITFYSNAEQEWEECLLKAEAIKKVLKEASTLVYKKR